MVEWFWFVFLICGESWALEFTIAKRPPPKKKIGGGGLLLWSQHYKIWNWIYTKKKNLISKRSKKCKKSGLISYGNSSVFTTHLETKRKNKQRPIRRTTGKKKKKNYTELFKLGPSPQFWGGVHISNVLKTTLAEPLGDHMAVHWETGDSVTIEVVKSIDKQTSTLLDNHKYVLVM